MRSSMAFAALALALALLPGLVAACAGAAPLALAPCDVEGLAPGEARCGTYEVFEDRGAGRGRKVPLRIVVVPATGSPREPDPLVYLAGGPGDSATGGAAFAAHAYAELRRRRDLVFVDLRGTGGSAGLFCPELAARQGVLDEFLPVEGVRACRRRLAARADLAQYTTVAAVDDLAEVLGALGYSRVNLEGGSYGTRTALEMMRRHPRLVRTAALSGIVPPGTRNPLTFARDAQEALEGTLAECAADAACAAAFPRLREDLAAVMARVERGPVTVEVTLRDGTRQALRLDRAGVAQTVRYMLYLPAASAELPFAVHAAAEGDFEPLAGMAALFAGMAARMADGFFLSVLCTEETPFVREEEIAPAVAGTFLGDFRIRAQQRACSEWKVPPAAPELHAPVRADVPVLLVSGERDPVTPARWGEQVARHLPRALHVVVPDGGHDFEGMAGTECLTALVEQLVARGDTRGLDTSCVERMARPPFTTAGPAPEVSVAEAELASLAGGYASDEGLQVDVRLADGKLRLTFAGKDFALVPTGERRFRVEGMPAGYGVEFFGAARVEGLRLLQGASEPLTLTRR